VDRYSPIIYRFQARNCFSRGVACKTEGVSGKLHRTEWCVHRQSQDTVGSIQIGVRLGASLPLVSSSVIGEVVTVFERPHGL
jgi:hypothetical protein